MILGTYDLVEALGCYMGIDSGGFTARMPHYTV